MNSMNVESHRSPLRHGVASDVGVLIQHSPHSTHWGKQPQALLDAVLEVNKLFYIITAKKRFIFARLHGAKLIKHIIIYLVISLSFSSFSLKMASTS